MSKFYGQTVTIYNAAKDTYASTNTDQGYVQQQKIASTWEQITVYCVAPDTVAFRSWNGKYVSMRQDFGLLLVDNIDTWQHFKIRPYGGPDPERYYIYSPTWAKIWKFGDGVSIYGRDSLNIPPEEEKFSSVTITIVD